MSQNINRLAFEAQQTIALAELCACEDALTDYVYTKDYC